ncbi:lipid II flippase FtsW [bacterium BMS3Abin03]|nr:lipid II flippase FtsW [bacterium BMS3Abin03]
MKKLALTIFFDAFVLMLLGLVIVMSASSTYSVFRFDSVFHLFSSHLFKVIVGISFMALFSFIPYDIYKSFSKPAVIILTLVLILTLFIAPSIKGAGRWLNLGFVSVQPADIARLVLLVHLAFLLDKKHDILENFRHGFLPIIIWVAVISSLIILQPNFSTGILVVLISLTIMFVGGAKPKHIFVSLISFFTAGVFAAMIYPHSRARILAFINSIQNGSDINLQVKQAIYSLGSGGLFGVGVGNSMQSNLFLPEAYGDFIFAILGEELGFIGAVLVLFSYLILFIAGILIAKKAKDRFGQLLAFGITISIITYAFINVAVTTGIVPTTGLPLPFISYGGTSLVFLCIGVGILINIAFSSNLKLKSVEDSSLRNQGNEVII